uniref:Tektin n=1 Tax=Echinostoma caproni TaxID=27848 RepID=A0A183ABK3_9TREM
LRTKWDEFNNTTRLADRIDAIRDLRDILDLAKTQVDEEISMEKELIEKSNNRLQQQIDAAFEQMMLLKEARSQLLIDLQQKNEAMDIDIEQYKLRPECPGVSYKPNPLRIPKGSTTPQQWENFSRYNWERAQAEIGSGQRLQNDLHQLELAIQNMIPAEKLAQTRLERRTYRPGVELCRDAPQYGLTDEVLQTQVSKEALFEKQRQCRHALDALHKQLNRINDDIAVKQASLALENQCIELRYQRMDRAQPQADPDPATGKTHATEMLSTIKEPPTTIAPNLATKLLA